jgi:hypothetical protein
MDRRRFIRAAGTLALAGVATQIAPAAAGEPHDDPQRKPRVLILEEPAFPRGEAAVPDRAALEGVFSGFDVAFLGAAEFSARLAAGGADVAVTPYGSYFPKEAASALREYLAKGGNWVNLGGVPLSRPVVREAQGWRAEASTTAYHKNLGITQAFPVDAALIASYRSPGFRQELALTASEIFELYVRFTDAKDFPAEDGSAGPRDAVLRPMVVGLDGSGEALAAPVIAIDRLMGPYAGGRWLLANFRGTISAPALREMIAHAAEGAGELTARMSLACYHDGEIPSLTVRLLRPSGEVRKRIAGPCQVELVDGRRRAVSTMRVALAGSGATASAETPLTTGRLAPGLYEVTVTVPVASLFTGRNIPFRYTTGFWVYDRALMEGGAAFTAGDQYLLRDGAPYPVTGTTYMGSDVHRKFLFEPNPSVWDRDFAAMKQSGVNMVRTGIWTGWKNLMLDVGAPNESAFRALDAFVLTARRHDIPLVVTLFAFLPEAWGGVNPYLDPRSVAAQKEFVTLFTRRYGMVRDIIWDLINEPSFCSPAHLWECRPNYDAFESAEWNAWLRRRYPAPAGGQDSASRLQELYRAAADEPVGLPTLEDFSDANIFSGRRPIKVIDYRLFAQEMFARWARELAATIRANGNAAQLITVGQDEGGTYERPANQFFAGAVDFTCVHNWWLNDALLWDNIVTKAPGKVNLVEETGVMFYETMEGKAWRTETEVANLLERKMALSLGAGGAGFIEWVWNTNCYMASDNEAAIGFHRADGTAKPELAPMRRYAAFMAAHRAKLTGRVAEEVLLVVPHSQMFSVRNFATEATQRCVRAMHYDCQVPMRAVSEYGLDAAGAPAKLVVVPSPRTLSDGAWTALLSMADGGATLLVTGSIDRDDHWLPADRLGALQVRAGSKPVAPEETLRIGDREFRLSYRGDKGQRLEKGVLAGGEIPSVASIPRGRGVILWSPLPVELAEQTEPTAALYDEALKRAGVVPVLRTQERDPALLVFSTVFHDTILVTLLSESDRDRSAKLVHAASGSVVPVTVPAGRALLMFVHRTTGSVLATTS